MSDYRDVSDTDEQRSSKRPGPSRWTKARRRRKKKKTHDERCMCKVPWESDSAGDCANASPVVKTVTSSSCSTCCKPRGHRDNVDSLSIGSSSSGDVSATDDASPLLISSDEELLQSRGVLPPRISSSSSQEGVLLNKVESDLCSEKGMLPDHRSSTGSEEAIALNIGGTSEEGLRNGKITPTDEVAMGTPSILAQDISPGKKTFRERGSSPTDGSSASSSDMDSSDDDWKDCKDMQIHFLDEEPAHHEEHPAAGGGDPLGDAFEENPDDPGNDSDPSSSEPDSDEEEGATFNFEDATLNTQLQVAPNVTRRDALLLTLAVSIRHNWTYESLIDSFKASNILFRGNPLPHSKKRLWSIVNKNSSGITKHAYCKCRKYLGKMGRLNDQVICQCGIVTQKKDLKWFVSINLRRQLEHFLQFPGIAPLLQYRQTRQKHNAEAVEDILDGERYQNLQQEGVISVDEHTLSYVFNTDGFRLYDSGNVSAWGLLVRLNELPPAIRQKHFFLAGLWVDCHEPNMNTFLRPFVQQANKLSSIGVAWKPDGLNEVRSKVIPLCCCVDSKARYSMFNMTQYNGEYGCTFCTHRGVQIEGSRYPILPFEELPPAVLRTHESIVNAMMRGEVFEGQKGPSELMLLDNYDMGAGGNAMDDLHPTYEGACKYFTDYLLQNVANEVLHVIDLRLSAIRTPSGISRKPSSIQRRNQWKGSEWRNWLLYYAIPCLHGLIPQNQLILMEHFSYAIFLLSRDSINPDDFEIAENHLQSFMTLHQERFGVYSMRYVLHLHTHTVRSVRNFGPLWTTSTFNFESWNGRMVKSVTSPKGVIDQIVTRHLLSFHVYTAMHSEALPENVRNQISCTIEPYERKIARNLGNNTILLGHPTNRRPSPEELEALNQHALNCNGLLSEYDRVLLNSTEYRNRRYHEGTRSDNSPIYTWDDWFGTIISIVVFRNQDGFEMCGFFVERHEINNPFGTARHFAQITGENVLSFVNVDTVRCPAIKLPVRDEIFVVPMSNCFEID